MPHCLRLIAATLVFAASAVVQANAASLDGLAVDVKNESEPVLCAEKDNVAVSFANKNVRSFRIEAAHPVYLSAGMRDNFEADWTACDMAVGPELRRARRAEEDDALRADGSLDRRLQLSGVLASLDRDGADRRPRREQHSHVAGLGAQNRRSRGGPRPLSAGRLLAAASDDAAQHAQYRLRVVVPRRADRLRGPPAREDQRGRVRSEERARSR